MRFNAVEKRSTQNGDISLSLNTLRNIHLESSETADDVFKTFSRNGPCSCTVSWECGVDISDTVRVPQAVYPFSSHHYGRHLCCCFVILLCCSITTCSVPYSKEWYLLLVRFA
ncbi:hypothetical protein Tcan_01070, partial [Toxocara canis]